MKNAYGNYVVQKALKLVNGNNKSLLISTLTKNLDKLSDKKLINKWRIIINNSLGNFLSLCGPNNVYSTNLARTQPSNYQQQMQYMSPQCVPTQLFNSNNNKFSRSTDNSPMLNWPANGLKFSNQDNRNFR